MRAFSGVKMIGIFYTRTGVSMMIQTDYFVDKVPVRIAVLKYYTERRGCGLSGEQAG
jgi:hypothetical protein